MKCRRIIKNDKYIINLYLQNCNTKNSVEQLLNHLRELLNCCGENEMPKILQILIRNKCCS